MLKRESRMATNCALQQLHAAAEHECLRSLHQMHAVYAVHSMAYALVASSSSRHHMHAGIVAPTLPSNL